MITKNLVTVHMCYCRPATWGLVVARGPEVWPLPLLAVSPQWMFRHVNYAVVPSLPPLDIRCRPSVYRCANIVWRKAHGLQSHFQNVPMESQERFRTSEHGHKNLRHFPTESAADHSRSPNGGVKEDVSQCCPDVAAMCSCSDYFGVCCYVQRHVARTRSSRVRRRARAQRGNLTELSGRISHARTRTWWLCQKTGKMAPTCSKCK